MGDLPAPPELLELLERRGSVSEADAFRNGADFNELLPHNRVAPEGEGLEFSPAQSGSSSLSQQAYAIWDFSLPDYDGSPAVLQLPLVVAEPEDLFFALGNVQSQRWDWYALRGNLCSLGRLESYIDSSERLLLVLLCRNKSQGIDWLRLNVNYAPSSGLSAEQSSVPGYLPAAFKLSAVNPSSGGNADDSIVSYEWDFEGDGTYDFKGPLPEIVHLYSSAGTYFPVLRITDEYGAQAVAGTELSVHVKPVAIFSVETEQPASNETLLLDATLSTDANGDICTYLWEFAAKPTPTAWIQIGSEAQINYLFAPDSDGKIRLTVTDSQGFSSAAIRSFTVVPAVELSFSVSNDHALVGEEVTIDASATTVWRDSIDHFELDLDLDGSPDYTDTDGLFTLSFSHSGVIGYKLSVIGESGRSGYALGQFFVSLSNSQLIDSEGNTGYVPAMALIAGNPAVAYRQYAPIGMLIYMRALDAQGEHWGAQEVVGAEGWSGWTLDLLELDGRPAIAYENRTAHDLRFTLGADAEGTAWSSPVVVATLSRNDVYCPDLTLVSGVPMLCWKDSFGYVGRLQFCSAQDGFGAAWNSPLLIDTAAHIWLPGLVDCAGHPAIVCTAQLSDDKDTSTYEQRFYRALDPSGLDWPASTILSQEKAFKVCPAIVDGLPAYAYTVEEGALYYRRALDAQGSAWDSPQKLADEGMDYTQLAVINGKPLVSGDNSNKVMSIHAADSTGSSWGEMQTVCFGLMNAGVVSPAQELSNQSAALCYSSQNDDYVANLYFVSWLP